MVIVSDANSLPVSTDVASFLRDQAHQCTRFARDCPHRPTAHRLEAVAVEMMLKASELEKELAE